MQFFPIINLEIQYGSKNVRNKSAICMLTER